MRHLIFLLPLFFWGSDLIAPGDPLLDTTPIHTASDTLGVILVDGGQASLAALMLLDTWRDADTIVRSERLMGGDGRAMQVDSFRLDALTLAPTYRGARMDRGTAFHSNALDLALASLPLSDGLAVDLALEPSPETDLIAAQTDTVASVRVVAADSVRLLTGELCAAWRIAVAKGETDSIYWIGRDSRKLMQFASPEQSMTITRLRGCR